MPKCRWRECSAMLDSEEALYDHLCSAHYEDDDAGAECRWKGCTVTPQKGQQATFKHLITHTDWRPFVCPEESCGARYARQSALKTHIENKHYDGVREPRRAKSLAPANLHPTKAPKHHSGAAAPEVKTGGAAKMKMAMSCEWSGCTAAGFTTAEQLSDHLLAAHAPTANGTCLWPSCNGKWFRPQNFSRHLRSAHHKPFATGCGRTFEELGAVGGGKLKRKRGGLKREVDTDGDDVLSALSEDEDEPTPVKRPRWPREPSFDSESEDGNDLRDKRIVELEGALKTQSTRLQVAEKKIKTLQKQLADMRKTAAKATKTVAGIPSGSTATKMEQHDDTSAPGELEQDEWTMWVDGVM